MTLPRLGCQRVAPGGDRRRATSTPSPSGCRLRWGSGSRSQIPGSSTSDCAMRCSHWATHSSRSSRRFATAPPRGVGSSGPGGTAADMVMVQVPASTPAREHASALGIREVFSVEFDDIAEVHLHPADMRGAIVSLSEPRPPASWRWGGPDWAARSAPLRVEGVRLAVADAERAKTRWQEVLGGLPGSRSSRPRMSRDLSRSSVGAGAAPVCRSAACGWRSRRRYRGRDSACGPSSRTNVRDHYQAAAGAAGRRGCGGPRPPARGRADSGER